MAKRDDTDKLDALLASVTEDMLGGDFGQSFADEGVRVERILLDLVRPDPVQPRRILPERVHAEFHSEKITPTQALKEVVRMAQIAARQQGRPFSNVAELLQRSDNDDETPLTDTLSPEEMLIYELAHLAVSLRDDGQVNPITVVDVTQGVTRLYRIETGERRYWASWLLRDFMPEAQGDGMIDCIIIPAERYSPFRQARENSAREGLSAVALARQAALLVIAANGVTIPDQLVSNDFYRQALEMRIPRDFAEAIYTAMGGIKKHYFSYLKKLLYLSDEAMELADRHNLEEKKLRHVVNLDAQLHAEVVRQIIEFNLTAAQVKAICEEDQIQEIEIVDDDDMPVTKQAMQIAKAMSKDLFAHDLARAFYKVTKNNREVARAYAQTMRRLADEIENYL